MTEQQRFWSIIIVLSTGGLLEELTLWDFEVDEHWWRWSIGYTYIWYMSLFIYLIYSKSLNYSRIVVLISPDSPICPLPTSSPQNSPPLAAWLPKKNSVSFRVRRAISTISNGSVGRMTLTEQSMWPDSIWKRLELLIDFQILFIFHLFILIVEDVYVLTCHYDSERWLNHRKFGLLRNARHLKDFVCVHFCLL